MKRDRQPVTAALRALRSAGIIYDEYPYAYVAGGGKARFAEAMGVDEHRVIKTLVMVDDRQQTLLVLMHGDREVSTKALARALAVKNVQPVDAATALRLTGYQVGGISPFGTRRKMPVYLQQSVARLPCIYVNGGRRGLLVGLAGSDLVRALEARLLDIAR